VRQVASRGVVRESLERPAEPQQQPGVVVVPVLGELGVVDAVQQAPQARAFEDLKREGLVELGQMDRAAGAASCDQMLAQDLARVLLAMDEKDRRAHRQPLPDQAASSFWSAWAE
jgi:hypothetical protein